ncbi:MAG: tetratricopeptide repeat protein [Kangiellaceae bacterium]|nr:tetratricopeptide repeat protein [Kangiellaceae bacterium]MCW8999566.1 tetratricopeptide repeat protein [Kangiellaceae bacterium]
MKNALVPVFFFSLFGISLTWLELNIFATSSSVKNINISTDAVDSFAASEPEKTSFPKQLGELSKLETLLVDKSESLIDIQKSKVYKSKRVEQKHLIERSFLKKLIVNDDEKSLLVAKQLSALSPSDLGLVFYSALAESRHGEREKAIELYRRVLLLNPGHQSSAVNLGLLYKKAGQLELAIEQLKSAADISSGSKKAKALASVGAIYFKQERFKEAIDNLQLSIQYRPDHARSWLMLAESMALAKYPYLQVETAFIRATKLAPSEYKYHQKLAEYQLNSLFFDKALSNYKAAIELAPFEIKSHRGMAWALFESGQNEQASRKWKWLSKHEKSRSRREYANIFSQFVVANKLQQQTLAKIITNQPLPKSLQSDYEYLMLIDTLYSSAEKQPNWDGTLILEFNERSNRSLLQRVRSALFHENYKLAQSKLEILLKTLSNNAEVQLTMAKTLGLQGLHQSARSYLSNALKLEPENVELNLLMVQNTIDRQQINEAVEQLNSLMQRYPDSFEVKDLTAELAWRNKDWKIAAKLYKDLLAADGENTNYYYRHAFTAYQKGELNSAKSSLIELLDRKVNHLPGRSLLAQVYCLQGEKQKCQFEARKILKFDSSHQVAQELVKL